MSTHESPEIGAAAARMIRALVDRAADKDTEALEQLAALEKLIPRAVTAAGWSMAHGGGYTHSELANVLGVSRQASVKRFGGVLTVDALDRGFHSRRVSATLYMRQLVTELAGRRS